MAGRLCAAFWIKEEKRNQGKDGEDLFRSDQKPQKIQGIHFFAKEGQGFAEAAMPGSSPSLPPFHPVRPLPA